MTSKFPPDPFPETQWDLSVFRMFSAGNRGEEVIPVLSWPSLTFHRSPKSSVSTVKISMLSLSNLSLLVLEDFRRVIPANQMTSM